MDTIQNTIPDKHYLYRHIRLDKDEPFYIGIGTMQECDIELYKFRRARAKNGRNSIWKSIVAKTDYEIEIMLESDDYNFLKQREIEFIKLYGRINLKTGTLANLTDGAEGLYNRVISDKSRERMSKSHMGKKLSPESQAKRIATLKEKYKYNPHPRKSEKERERLRQLQLGVKQSEAQVAKRINTIAKAKEAFKNGDHSVKTGHTNALINTVTLEIFPTITSAAASIGMKMKTLSAHLTGQHGKNITNFIYLRDYKSK